jgi:hypothetical protein
MQQVRAEIKELSVPPLEYLFERESVVWAPVFAASDELHLPEDTLELEQPVVDEARSGYREIRSWKLVKGLVPRIGSARDKGCGSAQTGRA